MTEESKYTQRSAEIIELRKQGKSWTQISTDLDIPRRSLYNLRHTEGFMAVANEIWLQIWEDIDKQRKVDASYNLNESIKNQIRLFTLLSGTSLDTIAGSEAKHAGCTPDCPYYEAHIMEGRMDADALLTALKLTPAQYRVLETFVKSESDYDV